MPLPQGLNVLDDNRAASPTHRRSTAQNRSKTRKNRFNNQPTSNGIISKNCVQLHLLLCYRLRELLG